MTTELRLATLSHLPLLLPLVQAFHALEDLETDSASLEKVLQPLFHDANLGGIWLIYHQAELAGYIALCNGYSIEFGGKDAFIDELYLLPQFRGQGLGTETLALIKIEARRLDIRALHLEVAHTNQPAQRLYRRAQFQPRDKYLSMTTWL
ncbi:MAG: GNAT family N-acetyltransferase [Leptolyngbyaceae cyanobacterium]